MRSVVSAIAIALIAPRGLAQATRTLTPDQDGRLTKAAPESGLAICYADDQVDNRTTVAAALACVDGNSSRNNASTVRGDCAHPLSFSYARRQFVRFVERQDAGWGRDPQTATNERRKWRPSTC